MALGNSNTSAQSRGKNKPILVKRRKEIVAAKDYNSISGTTVQARAACSVSSGSLSETYYHNGGRSTPNVNDIVYVSRRADNERGVLQNGFYKVTANNRDFFSIQIRYGVVAAVENCR